MNEPLQHHDFEPHLGKVFRFPGSHLALRLTSIDAADHVPVPGTVRQSFSLIFQGPAGDILPEGFYQAEVEDGPVFGFYIIPIHTPAHDRQDYQVVFN
ncbi:MAG: hypothetical protein P4L71_14710 [Acetobacteraceae bacterium]|nr:hypothetical protein [Acetobacteraceae bacterium]